MVLSPAQDLLVGVAIMIGIGMRCVFICFMLADMISFSWMAGVRLELEAVLEQ